MKVPMIDELVNEVRKSTSFFVENMELLVTTLEEVRDILADLSEKLSGVESEE